MNKEFITSQEIEVIVNEFGGQIQILTSSINEFNEPVDNELVTTITGLFYEDKKDITLQVNSGGQVSSTNSNTSYRLMTAQNEESKKIKINDTFEYNGDKYKIIDLGKFESSFYDIYLEKA